MGRPKKEIIYGYFRQEVRNGKKVVKCKFCDIKYLQNVTKMTNHLLKICKKISPELKAELQSSSKIKNSKEATHSQQSWAVNSEDDSIEVIEIDAELDTGTDTRPMNRACPSKSSAQKSFSSNNSACHLGFESPGSAAVKSQPNAQPRPQPEEFLSTFIDKMNESEQNKIWSLLAKAIYVSGIPLSIFEEPHWIRAFQAIRPALVLPSRYHLSNSLLTQEYDGLREKVNDEISQSQSFSLQLDGFTGRKTESVSNFNVTTPEPFLYKSVHSGINCHTTDYLFGEICGAIDEIGPDKFC